MVDSSNLFSILVWNVYVTFCAFNGSNKRWQLAPLIDSSKVGSKRNSKYIAMYFLRKYHDTYLFSNIFIDIVESSRESLFEIDSHGGIVLWRTSIRGDFVAVYNIITRYYRHYINISKCYVFCVNPSQVDCLQRIKSFKYATWWAATIIHLNHFRFSIIITENSRVVTE